MSEGFEIEPEEGKMSRPLPTAVKEARGSYNRHPERRSNGEPQPFGKPEKPDHVAADKIASDAWDRICGLLSEMGVLSQSDEMALELLAVAYSSWRRALDRIREGEETAEGAVYSAAAVRECREASDKIVRLLIECGLTPAARTKVQAASQEAKTDWFTEALKKRESNS